MLQLPKVKRFRKWESLFIIHPDFVQQKDEILKKIQEIVESKEGKLLKIDEWGMRKLAYPIAKKNQGFYVLIEFYGLAELPKDLENYFRIDERIIRFIIVKLKDRIDPEKIQLEEENKREEVGNV